MFGSEAALTETFDTALSDINSPFISECSAVEFDYREGRTDVILADGDGNLLAFEMKLDKWKQAMHQAFRNSSFAHYSYVVVPSDTARRALKYEYEFQRRGVGLCSVDSDGIKIEIDAKWAEPLRPWLTKLAIEYISAGESCQVG